MIYSFQDDIKAVCGRIERTIVNQYVIDFASVFVNVICIYIDSIGNKVIDLLNKSNIF